ncbi:MAG: hypothetical protein A3F12_08070 [Gammaproteobacteria bacterium RIFCSPHIGHO2_12_FULL_38_14]|nr:MAG: hypothetical protein A3F12_08070 [Gammaproteobacteria bacterium RIFCSPHIGHO2_12_FULL_38_14]
MMSLRQNYILGFIIACILLTTSVYLQLFDGFIPCPLCTLQRFSFFLIGFFFLILIFIYKRTILSMFIHLLAISSAVMGLVFAGRQIYLQHFSSGGNECGVSIQYMLQVLPLSDVAQKIFAGSAECSVDGWTFLRLNMAEWTFLWFIFFLFFTIYLSFKHRQYK